MITVPAKRNILLILLLCLSGLFQAHLKAQKMEDIQQSLVSISGRDGVFALGCLIEFKGQLCVATTQPSCAGIPRLTLQLLSGQGLEPTICLGADNGLLLIGVKKTAETKPLPTTQGGKAKLSLQMNTRTGCIFEIDRPAIETMKGRAILQISSKKEFVGFQIPEGVSTRDVGSWFSKKEDASRRALVSAPLGHVKKWQKVKYAFVARQAEDLQEAREFFREFTNIANQYAKNGPYEPIFPKYPPSQYTDNWLRAFNDFARDLPYSEAKGKDQGSLDTAGFKAMEKQETLSRRLISISKSRARHYESGIRWKTDYLKKKGNEMERLMSAITTCLEEETKYYIGKKPFGSKNNGAKYKRM